ncbi:hypothetical protein [Neobacillus terrae]|uniref:hypothetical protein n=1 Tax=Neobacillus terrae TaxID=3034837 RepID=UPI00140DD42E|nr:hypothetical protein [Neobacillus terrae]NHM31866.1 hypothetical protein [Neobacillus terrae]
MKLNYEFNKELLSITEKVNEEDIEFSIVFKNVKLAEKLEKVHQYFDLNEIHTDALFFTNKDGSNQIIVKKDFYEDFILQLFKQQLLERLKWE